MIKIFTESGSTIGQGHVSRCMSLYDEIAARGIDVEFIINGDVNQFSIVQNRNFKMVNWLSRDFLNNYISKDDYCIVDSYLASEDLYRVISSSAKRSLFIDDNARIKYPKGIVVNPSLSTNAVMYPENDNNYYLLGHEYIILRSPFIQVKRSVPKTNVKEILITLGGADIHNLTPTILNLFINRFSNLIVNVVIGNAFKNAAEIRKFNSENVNIYENATGEEMQKIMLKSDIAITAAGQTIYELISTQTPFIPIKVIDNQENNIIGLKELNLNKTVLNYEDEKMFQKLEVEFSKLLELEMREKLYNLYDNTIDGLGSKRIIDKLLSV